MAGDARVWDLRNLREVVIPEGVEGIGRHWFYYTAVESVTIPASVREIGARAFCRCWKLRKVEFKTPASGECS